MPFSISQIDTSSPSDLLPASQLCVEIRQLKTIIRGLLETAFADDMTLLPGSVQMTSIGDASIGSSQISDNSILARHLTTECVGSANIQDESIFSRHLAINAVKTEHIVDGAVNNNKIAPNTIEGSRIKQKTITSDNLADGCVGAAQVASIPGDKITANSVPETVFKTDSAYTTPRIPIITASVSKYAAIGGDLSATYEASTNTIKFVYQPSAANRGGVVVFRQDSTGETLSGFSAKLRDGLSFYKGNTNLGSIAGSTMKINVAGVYLVLLSACGYSCGRFRVALVDAGDNSALVTGTAAYAGPGQQGISVGFGVIEVGESDDNQFKLAHYSELAQPSNGQGLLTGTNDATAYVTFVQLG